MNPGGFEHVRRTNLSVGTTSGRMISSALAPSRFRHDPGSPVSWGRTTRTTDAAFSPGATFGTPVSTAHRVFPRWRLASGAPAPGGRPHALRTAAEALAFW
jgi:hypothetical protein